ncbi:MAG: glycogen synthase, partial [Bacteroidetes bacterium]
DPEKFAKDLANGVNTLINNKELKDQMAKKGRKRVEDTFDWSAIAKEHKELYKSLKK